MKFKNLFISFIVAVLTIGAMGFTPANSDVDDNIVKRGWNVNHYENRDGTNTASFHSKWINYLDLDDAWKPIDNYFVDAGTHFEMTEAPFTVIVPKRSVGMAKFISNNRWDIFNKEKIEDAPLDMNTWAQGVADVPGRIETGDLGWGETNYVVFEGAYPEWNADLIYWVHNGTGTRLRRLVRFNSNPNATEDLNISFDLNLSGNVNIKNHRANWNGETKLRTKERISLRPENAKSSARGIGLKQFFIWEDPNEELTPIDVEFVKKGSGYRLTKIIPKDYLDNATYPVYTDDSASFNPDASPESTSVDGITYNGNPNASWATARSAAASWSSDTLSTRTIPGLATDGSGNWYDFGSLFMVFDTSSLSGATVSAASIDVYCNSSLDDLSDSVRVVTHTSASSTAIATGDHRNVGSTTQATADKDITTMSCSGGTNTFTLNATGIGNVNVAGGVTKFALRGVADADNSQPGGGASKNSGPNLNMAESASNDPQLDVTYSSGWSGGVVSGVDPLASVSGVDVGDIASVSGVE
jgi:hypothetical protein